MRKDIADGITEDSEVPTNVIKHRQCGDCYRIRGEEHESNCPNFKSDQQLDIEMIDRFIEFYHQGYRRQSPQDSLPGRLQKDDPNWFIIDTLPLVLAWARVKEALKHD